MAVRRPGREARHRAGNLEQGGFSGVRLNTSDDRSREGRTRVAAGHHLVLERRTAVLVDGDNLSAKHSGRILSEAGKLGRIDVARVYAAANRPSDWLTTPGYRLMFAGAGKNAADLLLSMDAIELALVGGIEAFAIATSDRDYTHLAHRLRERGLVVLGFGEPKSPEDFRLSCSEFLPLTSGKTGPEPAVTSSPARTLTVRNS